MIQRLHIRNYAIIEELEIHFSKGLTIITGETGAGKSIVLGALGLIMGKRADTKSLYDEDKKCVIEAHFDIKKYKLQSFFEENDIDDDAELVVRRELNPSGKSRSFINDTPVNLKQLQQLSGALIDLHQQFDTLDIHNVSFQLRMIDALAENHALLEKYQQLFNSYQSNKRQLLQLIDQNASAGREMDFLNFQLEEFYKAELVEGEQAKMEEEQATLSNAEDIKRILSAAHQHIEESEQAVTGQLSDLSNTISSVKDFHPDIEALYQRLESSIYELQDISQELNRIAENTEYDGSRITELQERLDLIYKLQSKHNVTTIDELLQIQQNLQNQLDGFGDLSATIATLEAKIAKEEEQLQKLAQQLSKRRKSVVAGFEKKVHQMLQQLSMPNARLQVAITPLEELSSTGLDDINFLFAANKGGRLQAIKDVASGGELSRLTLCTKSLVASAIPLPTLIFDEIDSGVSGDVALKMGSIMKNVSLHHQLVVITHSPQIASKADTHYFIYKKDKKDRTVTKVKQLSLEERVRAIATMLSSNPPSDSAIENARELLQLQMNS